MEDQVVQVENETEVREDGRILFADEVVATIASLAVADVEGVSGMSGTVAEGLTSILGKRNVTKGVKVQVGTEEVVTDISVIVKYGYRIQDVCKNIQASVRTAIETMTGLRSAEVNVFVQSIVVETAEKKKKEIEASVVEPEAKMTEETTEEA